MGKSRAGRIGGGEGDRSTEQPLLVQGREYTPDRYSCILVYSLVQVLSCVGNLVQVLSCIGILYRYSRTGSLSYMYCLVQVLYHIGHLVQELSPKVPLA